VVNQPTRERKNIYNCATRMAMYGLWKAYSGLWEEENDLGNVILTQYVMALWKEKFIHEVMPSI
jgi:hypothetical protein